MIILEIVMLAERVIDIRFKCLVSIETVEINVCPGFNNYLYEQFFRKQVTGVLFQNRRLASKIKDNRL